MRPADTVTIPASARSTFACRLRKSTECAICHGGHALDSKSEDNVIKVRTGKEIVFAPILKDPNFLHLLLRELALANTTSAQHVDQRQSIVQTLIPLGRLRRSRINRFKDLTMGLPFELSQTGCPPVETKTYAATGVAYPVGSPLASFPDDRNGNV